MLRERVSVATFSAEQMSDVEAFHLQNNKELLIEEWPIINLKQLLTFVPKW